MWGALSPTAAGHIPGSLQWPFHRPRKRVELLLSDGEAGRTGEPPGRGSPQDGAGGAPPQHPPSSPTEARVGLDPSKPPPGTTDSVLSLQGGAGAPVPATPAPGACSPQHILPLPPPLPTNPLQGKREPPRSEGNVSSSFPRRHGDCTPAPRLRELFRAPEGREGEGLVGVTQALRSLREVTCPRVKHSGFKAGHPRASVPAPTVPLSPADTSPLWVCVVCNGDGSSPDFRLEG